MRYCPVCDGLTEEDWCPECKPQGLVLTLKIPSWKIWEALNPELVAMYWCQFWLFSRVKE